MTVNIGTTANIDQARFKQEISHPASPASGYEVLYVISGSAHGGLFVKDSAGREIGPFITGSPNASTPDYLKFYESGAVVSISGSSTSEITFFSGSFGGGLLGANGSLSLEALVNINHPVAGIVTVRFYYGSQVASIAMNAGVNAASKTGRLHLRMGNRNATNRQFVEIYTLCLDGTATYYKEGNGFLSVDSTSNQTIQLTAQWDTSNNGLSYNQYHVNMGYYPSS